MISLRSSSRPTFRHGVHPPERKDLSKDRPVEVLPTPREVQIPLLQHAGTACTSVVKTRDKVRLGDLVGESGGFVSARVHASVQGTVGQFPMTTLPNGRRVPTVSIKADPEQLSGRELWEAVYGGEWNLDGLDAYPPDRIRDAVQGAGIVGFGGAAFPTHVKLAPGSSKPIDTVIVNGCECEPYLTSDQRLMLEAPGPILAGAILAALAAGAERILVAVEDNKPEAAETLRQEASNRGISVRLVKTRYPMGSERQLVPTLLNRQVPFGGFPVDVGVVVINVATAAAVARAVLREQPVTHRIVSISGGGIRRPANLLVPIGASYAELIEHCGGLTPDAARVIAGGPMMGFALGNLQCPVTKGTSGITVLTRDEVRRTSEMVCVRCGRCVDVCPLNLVPTKVAQAASFRDWELARRYHITACVECGCCAYACPSNVPLVQIIRAGKAQMPRGQQASTANKAAVQ